MAAPLSPKIQDLVARLNRDPDSKIFLQLAEEYRRAGLLEEALLVCKGGLKKHPGYQSARVALGRIYLALGRLEEARAEFESVVRTAPENLLANRMLGDVLAMGGDAAGARDRYRAVVQYGPADNEMRRKLEALERGEDPRQVGRWGNETAGPVPSPPVAAARPAAPPARPARGAASAPPAAPAPRPPAAASPSPAPDPPPAMPAAASAASPARPEARPARQAAPPVRSAPPPVPVPPPPASEEGGRQTRDSMSTQTLAELYVRQGFIDRAIDVYRRMLNHDPANPDARRRLAELVRRAPPEMAAALAAGGTGAPGEPAQVIGRLERWLRAIQGGGR